jgi:hypothetical protein
VCHLPESYCIKDVPVAEVLSAIDAIENGRVVGRETVLLKPDAALMARVGREGAVSARQRLTELSVSRREHMEQNESLGAVLERALKQAGRAEALAEELDATKAEMARREAILKQRLAAAESLFNTREAELRRRLASTEGATVHAPTDVSGPADLYTRVHQLQADLAKAHAEALQAKAEASDLKLKLTRAEAERGTLANLSRQHEGEVVVLRHRLHDLLASRWRRYGQKLHLCMTLPWEREFGNGRHHG